MDNITFGATRSAVDNPKLQVAYRKFFLPGV
jgi:hypothetical protein